MYILSGRYYYPLLFLLTSARSAASPIERSWADDVEFNIKKIYYDGTGCPQGSVGLFISRVTNNSASLTLIYDDIVGSIGYMSAVAENRKNCTVQTDLLVPKGYKLQVVSDVLRMYASLEKGAILQMKDTIYWGDRNVTDNITSTLVGPLNGDVEKAVTLPGTTWGPCAQDVSLSLNTQSRLTSSTKPASGWLPVETPESKVTKVYGLTIQKC